MHVILFVVIIVIVVGGAVYLVSRLPAFVDWRTLKDFPTTNGRVASSLVLTAIYVLTLLAMMVMDRPINTEAAGILAVFLAANLGLDYKQFKAKRETEFRKPGEMTTAEHRAATFTPVEYVPPAGEG